MILSLLIQNFFMLNKRQNIIFWGLNGNIFYIKSEGKKIFNSYESAQILVKNSLLNEDKFTIIGIVGQINQHIMQEYKIKSPIYALELFLDPLFKFLKQTSKSYNLAKYPSIRRDLSLVLNKNIKAQDITDIIKCFFKDIKILKDFFIFDIYKGKGVHKNKKSISISFIFKSFKRTLIDKEVSSVMENLIIEMNKRVNANVRYFKYNS